MAESPLKKYEGKVLVTYSSYVSNQLFEVAWRKLETTMKNQNVEFTPINGADPENKELRNALFELSGARAYPQVFIPDGSAHQFVGDMDKIQEMLDTAEFQTVFAKYITS